MHRPGRWLVMASLAVAVGCSDSPTQPRANLGSPSLTITPASCQERSPLAQTFLDYNFMFGCQAKIWLDTTGGGLTGSQRGDVVTAVNDWNSVLNQSVTGLPKFYLTHQTGDSRITISVSTQSGSNQFEGANNPSGGPVTTNINLTASTATNAAPFLNILHVELTHVLGFGDQWESKFATAGVSDHCVRYSQNAPNNSTPCEHEIEDLFYTYGLRPNPSMLDHHILTGFSGLPPTVQVVPTGTAPVAVSALVFNRVNPAFCSPPLQAPRFTATSPALYLTPPPCPDSSTIGYTWSSDNSAIATVSGSGPAATITGGATLGTTVVRAAPSVAGVYDLAFFFTGDSIVVTNVSPTPTAITFTAGKNQTATVHTNVAVSPTVTVTGSGGIAIPGDTVDFTVTAGGGSAGSAFGVTDASGHASTTWQMGTTAGTQILKAVPRHTALAAYDTATATAGTATTLSIVSGNNQTAAASTTLAARPTVKVADTYGNGVSGVTVTFGTTTPVQNGSVTPTSAATSGTGAAATQWTLGVRIGPDTMTATVTGLTGSPARFLATGTAASGTLSVISCRSQTFGSKVYNYFTLSWSGASSGAHSIYENSANDTTAAYVVGSGSGSSGSVEVGPYLHQAVANNRYWWLDETVGAVPNPTDTSNCQL